MLRHHHLQQIGQQQNLNNQLLSSIFCCFNLLLYVLSFVLQVEIAGGDCKVKVVVQLECEKDRDFEKRTSAFPLFSAACGAHICRCESCAMALKRK
jgi:hypothetical protein